MLQKIISGGQTGADQAGLRAAKACGLETGGWLPQGCITLEGARADLLSEFGMKEHAGSGYPPRTEANVRDSDGTVRFAEKFSSAGEKCTLRAIKWFNRPHFDIDVKNPKDKSLLLDWLRENDIKVLNVAGNSEETSPGIGAFVYNYLTETFSEFS